FLARRFDRGFLRHDAEACQAMGGVLQHYRQFWYDTSVTEGPIIGGDCDDLCVSKHREVDARDRGPEVSEIVCGADTCSAVSGHRADTLAIGVIDVSLLCAAQGLCPGVEGVVRRSPEFTRHALNGNWPSVAVPFAREVGVCLHGDQVGHGD